jgi:hypothetical protein
MTTIDRSVGRVVSKERARDGKGGCLVSGTEAATEAAERQGPQKESSRGHVVDDVSWPQGFTVVG